MMRLVELSQLTVVVPVHAANAEPLAIRLAHMPVATMRAAQANGRTGLGGLSSLVAEITAMRRLHARDVLRLLLLRPRAVSLTACHTPVTALKTTR